MKKPTKTPEKLNFKPVKKQSSAKKRAAAHKTAITPSVEKALDGIWSALQEPRPYEEPTVAAAIEAEVADWAVFFNVSDADQIEARRNVMRANVAVGYLEPLLKYLSPAISDKLPNPFQNMDA